MKKSYDYNSNENQEIKGKFVAREVKTCFSYEMQAILSASNNAQNKEYPLPTYDDIENMYEWKCPECGNGFASEEEAKTCCNSETDPENEPQEIYEWWIISEFLYNKLKEKGYAVLEWGNNYYWGRCTTGQAILLDSVISEICSNMEILQGQKYDWSKK